MKPTVRVAFMIGSDGSSWTGGSNYLSNVLGAIAQLDDRRIETVLFVPPEADDALLTRFPADHIVRSTIVKPRSPLRLAGKVLERMTGRNHVMEAVLRRHHVDVLSHVAPLGPRSTARVLSWIPDFQERHLPDFFAADEVARRETGYRAIVAGATRIILSSEDARADLATLYPQAVDKARVLRFVAMTKGTTDDRSGHVADTYGVDGPYFYLPNQFWIHKNHAVVVAALAILKARGVPATVIATGSTNDYRHPDFFDRFRQSVVDAGVEDRFRIAGLVPFEDVGALARHSVALINPSLFEGWSTTVEEAKSAGKRILLSDIPVHREQAPERGAYFGPHDAAALADLMTRTIADHDLAEERRHAAAAAADLPARIQAFASTYQSIVLDAVA